MNGTLEEGECPLYRRASIVLASWSDDRRGAVWHRGRMSPSLQELVTSLSRDLDLPVVLEDADQQPLVHGPHHGPTDRMRLDTILHGATSERTVEWFSRFDLASHADPFVVPGDPDDEILPRLCVPLRWDGRLLGYVWVLLPDGVLDDAGWAVVERARDPLAEVLGLERLSRLQEGRLVEDLIGHDPDRRRRGQVELEARRAFDDASGLAVLVCGGPGWAVPAVRRAFAIQRWAADPTRQLRHVDVEEGVVVVAADGPPNRDALERVLAQLARVADGQRLVVGIGPTVPSAGGVHRAHQRARQAVTVALRTRSAVSVVAWADLGVHRLLVQLPRDELAEAVDPRLLRLVEREPEAVATLEAWLDRAGAVAATAEALHVHRSTLYARLEKVTEAGVDLQDGADRLALHVGIAALRLLGRWPTR